MRRRKSSRAPRSRRLKRQGKGSHSKARRARRTRIRTRGESEGRNSPIGPATRFHIVSASKTFVAASVLALAARGALTLDDPARRHLPELRATVTIRQLLSMVSGPMLKIAPPLQGAVVLF
jgi:CubicO group peptidase (beta-lactamase class C family)